MDDTNIISVPVRTPMHVDSRGMPAVAGTLSRTWILFFEQLANGMGPGAQLPLVIETPAGAMDGANKKFTLSFGVANDNWLLLMLNGVYQEPTNDFSLTGKGITFTVAPKASDYALQALYIRVLE